ncbi:hypothetical protein G6F31_019453 [Rhizopus arrhizus]|nr:hypothetical protein G6F31_019453 [Rhizopus arrhizus]
MAILLFENGKGEVVTAPHELRGSRRHRPAAARRRLGRTDVHHRRTHHRPEPGRRQHLEGLPFDVVRFPGHRRLHHPVLPPVRRVLHGRPDPERAAAAGAAVHAAGHAHPARHRRYRADARHGH